MKVVLATDHGGFELKEKLKPFIESLGHEVIDVGAHTFDMKDDYVPFMQAATRKILEDINNTKGIIIGGSGQGEAMACNRFKGIRAAVYYGEPKRKQKDADGRELDILTSTIGHNNANVLSLGGRFLSEEEAKAAVQKWLSMTFSGAERHVRRITMLDENL